MKIGVFGGTQGVGKCFIEQALEKGHSVTALARNAESLKGIKDERLKIVEGDVLDKDKVDQVVKGQEVIVNCLGSKVLKGQGIDICSKGTEVILKSMQENQVKRIVTCSSLGTNESYQYCGYITRFFIWAIISNAIKDKNVQENLIFQSGLDYLVVRPAGLTNGKLTQKYQAKPNISGGQISRQDVAHFIINNLKQSTIKTISLAY